ncbi:SDR family oxidoreductase [Candidatus Sumerlaeota bacterium]|nr:SDR family oxidoreductase [Candidatus Sumerlaeota bacterium]
MSTIQGCVIVTGGAQGIGKGIASHLLENGVPVAILDCDAEAGEECLRQWNQHAQRMLFTQTDVANEDSVRSGVDTAVERFKTIGGLVNNAGIATAHGGSVETLALEDWNRVIGVNLTGCFLLAKHATPHLRKSRGAIVNIASTRALQSEPNTEAYAASKGGIVALTHALAISLGPEIRVNCISPGWIEVGPWKKSSRRKEARHSDADRLQHPAGIVGEPQDIASAVEYLLSESSRFITGQNLIIDGGMTKKMIYV